MGPKETLKNVVDVSGIFLEAGKLLVQDTVAVVKAKAATKLSEIDEWLADYGDEA